MTATLATKYGPAEGGAMTTEVAVGQLEAYRRIVQAGLEARYGLLQAPVFLLSAEQLGSLFAPQQLAALIKLPLARPARNCL